MDNNGSAWLQCRRGQPGLDSAPVLLGQLGFRRASVLIQSAVASQCFTAALDARVLQSSSAAADSRGSLSFRALGCSHGFRGASGLLRSAVVFAGLQCCFGSSGFMDFVATAVGRGFAQCCRAAWTAMVSQCFSVAVVSLSLATLRCCFGGPWRCRVSLLLPVSRGFAGSHCCFGSNGLAEL